MPLTKTTNTAAYAALAANTSAFLAFVKRPNQTAKRLVYPAMNPNRFPFWVTKYKLRIAPKRSVAAEMVLMTATTI